jgi:hypothetical protein
VVLYQTVLTLYGPMLPHGCDRDADGHQVYMTSVEECHGGGGDSVEECV